MADSLVLTFEVSRGDEFLFREQLSAESVTIGKGPAAMLHIEDDALADLQAVINLTDNGSVQVLDLVGEGTSLNGEAVVNAPLATGDLLEMGEIQILVQFEGGVAPDDAAPEPTSPMDGSDEEDDELADASVHTVGDLDLTDKTDAEILQEDMAPQAPRERDLDLHVEEDAVRSAMPKSYHSRRLARPQPLLLRRRSIRTAPAAPADAASSCPAPPPCASGARAHCSGSTGVVPVPACARGVALGAAQPSADRPNGPTASTAPMNSSPRPSQLAKKPGRTA